MADLKKIRLFEISQDCDKWDYSPALAWLNGLDCKYMIVKHDKDDTRPHYHLLVQLNGARSLEDITKNTGTEYNFIEFKRKWKDSLAYLFHLTENAKKDNKYIYDSEAIIACRGCNYEEIVARDEEFETIKGHDKVVKELMYKYGNCELSFSELMKNISVVDFTKFNNIFKRCKEYRQFITKDREMRVIYICGSSGSGKTTYAKFLAKQNNYDVFVSGSGKDIFDGYDKQECIILDDLRADSFTKAELFKLCDNNTNSSVKSRYANKDISQCKLMIITSVKRPYMLYNWQEDLVESFKQFNRRLGNSFVFVPSKSNLPLLLVEEDDYGKDFSKQSLGICFDDVKEEMGIVKKNVSNFDFLRCSNLTF